MFPSSNCLDLSIKHGCQTGRVSTPLPGVTVGTAMAPQHTFQSISRVGAKIEQMYIMYFEEIDISTRTRGSGEVKDLNVHGMCGSFEGVECCCSCM